MIILVFFALCLSVIYICYVRHKSQSVLPSGLKEIPLEKGVPALGILPQIEAPLVNYLAKLGTKHGPLFKIRMGMRDIVVLNNFDVIKKSLKENGYTYSGRLKSLFIERVSRDSGLIFTDGDKWVQQRSFMMSVLREFGVGKAKSQEIVQDECRYLLDKLRSLEGRSVRFSDLIPLYTANIISKFIMNKRSSGKDPKFQFIVDVVTENSKSKDFISLFQIMFPCFDESKILDHLLKTLTHRWKRYDRVHSFFEQEIEDHKKKLDLHSEGEDLIDRFLIKQQEMKEKVGDVDTFTDFQLVRNSFELFAAGYETTSTLLVWAMFFMSAFPDIQEKVHLEIIDKIGNQRMPTMTDRKCLTYTQAVMDEVMRVSSVLGLALYHKTLTDSNINGYFVPKNSCIFPNLFATHFDPITWENPTEFLPERFLFSDNDGELRYTPREELIPFSLGKRQCAGEALARMEYFIIFTSILQKCNVSSLEKIDRKKYEEVLRGNEGFIRFSKVKNFIFSFRQ